MVSSLGSSAALRNCSTYFSMVVSLLLTISLSSVIAASVSFTGCSVTSAGVSITFAMDASVKRALTIVASVSENRVLANSFIFLIAFAVGARYFSNRCGGKYIKLLNTPMVALSSSAKFMRISSRDLLASIMLLGMFSCRSFDMTPFCNRRWKTCAICLTIGLGSLVFVRELTVLADS